LFLADFEIKGYKIGYIANYKKTLKKFFRLMVDPLPKWVVDMKIKRDES